MRIPFFIQTEDSGIQARLFYIRLKKHHMKQNMSRVAHCIDNEPMEGFWGIVNAK